MKRRSFLRHLSHAVAVPGLASTMSFKMPGANSLSSFLRLAGETDRVLVLVFLEGGNDGLNTVIPLSQLSNLNRVRPHVMLPESSLIDLGENDLALHPSLSGLKSLFSEDRLQIIQNVGYPDQNYSHFRSTDIWMSASDSNELVNSGWGGRYLNDRFKGFPEEFPNEEMPDPLAVEIGYGGSLLFQGPEAAMSMVINDPSFFYRLVDNEEEEAPDTPAGDKLKYIRLIERQSQQYGQVVSEAAEKARNIAEFPRTFIGEQLKIVSRLIAGGLQTPVYMVRLGGFDTHDAQVESSDHTIGEHATLLKQLDEAVMAFMKDLEAHENDERVLGMTFSEFGRRIVSNASLGTDHGSSAPMFFFGNKVRGGVVGSNPVIPSNAVYNTNLPFEHDFRQMYGSVLEQWFDLSNEDQSNALLDEFETIPLIGVREKPLSFQDNRTIKLYPNPVKETGNLTLNIGVRYKIDILDLNGKILKNLYNGVNRNTTLSFSMNGFNQGIYLIRVVSDENRRTLRLVKI